MSVPLSIQTEETSFERQIENGGHDSLTRSLGSSLSPLQTYKGGVLLLLH